MGRRNKTQAQAVLAPVVEEIVEVVVEREPLVLEDLRQQALDDAEIEAQIAQPRSVVKSKYKVKYRDRARANGETRKAAKRSAWDWLAQTLAGEVLDERNKLRVDDFLALLDANGVDHSRWQNRAPGWEGRLRMTGGLALRPIVAAAGFLRTADGEELEAPADWVAKHLN